MALVLVIGAGLLMRSFVALKSVDPGYDTRDVFTFQFAPEQPALVDGPSWARFHLDFVERLNRLPGVTSVGIVENVPLDEGTDDDRFRTDEMPEGPDVGPNLRCEPLQCRCGRRAQLAGGHAGDDRDRPARVPADGACRRIARPFSSIVRPATVVIHPLEARSEAAVAARQPERKDRHFPLFAVRHEHEAILEQAGQASELVPR